MSREAAVAAAGRGWHVFPCRPGDKRPAVDRWEERACADPARVASYWPSDRHNVGGACGPSRLVVIDLDTVAHATAQARQSGGGDGRDVLAVLADRIGQPWPSTYTVVTPSGGLHLYFAAIPGRMIRNSAGRVGPLIDVRAAGGYVLLAGSVIAGRAYEVADGRAVDPLPAWLAELADPPRPARPAVPVLAGSSLYGRLRGIVAVVLSSEPGTRNGRLYWAACRAAEMVAAGIIDQAAAEELLVDAAVEAGLRGGEPEARRTVRSGLRGEGAR